MAHVLVLYLHCMLFDLLLVGRVWGYLLLLWVASRPAPTLQDQDFGGLGFGCLGFGRLGCGRRRAGKARPPARTATVISTRLSPSPLGAQAFTVLVLKHCSL